MTTTCTARKHGTANAYRNHHCRCDTARVANTRYNKRRRAGLHEPGWVPAIGVVRRRQALAAMGYSLSYLAKQFGQPERAVGNYLRRPHVHRDTLQRWVQLYDQLSMTPGPSQKARDHARKMGWVPPLAWDDDEIDDPQATPAVAPRAWKGDADQGVVDAVLGGDVAARTRLRPAERWAIVQRLHADGLTDPQIAARTGMHRRTAQNIRQQLCLPSNAKGVVRARSGLPPRRSIKGAA